MSGLNEELVRSLRLTGPDGDERSQALWLALLPCVALGHALQDKLARAALLSHEQALPVELHARLHFALNHTPLAEPRRRQAAMKSREKWMGDGLPQGERLPHLPDDYDYDADLRKHYRRYSISVRTVEFKAAHEILKVLFDMVRVARTLGLDEQGRSYRSQLVAALEAAKPEIKKYAAVVRRMNTMERLGGMGA